MITATAHGGLPGARDALRRGIAAIPVPAGSKKPAIKEWQHLRLSESDLPTHFNGKPQNAGGLWGAPSGGKIDVDLDANEATALAPVFLPKTGLIYGRRQRRCSHWVYVVEPATKTRKFQDPTRPDNDEKAMLVELRSTGTQSLLPGSTHPSGDVYEWDQDGEPATVDTAELVGALERLAAATLLARHWPGQGSRHEAALALAGGLVRGGWPQGQVDDFIRNVAAAAGDEEADDRAQADSTARRIASGGTAYGWNHLRELVGDKVVARAREWLGMRSDPPASTSEQSSSSSPSPSKYDDDDELLDGLAVPRNAAERLATATSTLATMAERYSAAPNPLAGPYVHRSELLMGVGPPESFKSWFFADLVRAVHTGGLWLGSMRVPQGKVLHFEQERARNFIYQTDLLARGWGQDLSGIATVEPCGINLCDPDWQRAISRMVEAAQPALVVFNSYRAVFRGKPPDSADVALALGWLGHLAERTRAAIAIVDGTNKAGAIGQLRGMAAHGDSIQKEYECDTVLHIERKRDALGRGVGPARVYVGKQRHGVEIPPPFVFDVIKHGDGVRALWLDETDIDLTAPSRPLNGDERVLLALPANGDPRPLTELPDAANLTLGSVKNTLTKLRGEGLVESPQRGLWRRVVGSSLSSPTSYDDDDEPETGPSNSSSSSPLLRGSDDDDYRVADTPAVEVCSACSSPAARHWSDGTPLCERHYPRRAA